MMVVCSWDPNDKTATPEGQGPNKVIARGEPLTYRIDFENKKEATAEAVYILVLDTLDPKLDWSTLAEGSSSHADKCKMSFDPYTGVLSYFCDGVMLPPNVNSPEGEGYFTYSISPRTDLPSGTTISNRAHIRFDYNDFLAAPESGPLLRTLLDACACPCHGDPICDGLPDVFDIIQAIEIVFSGENNVIDESCPHAGRVDVNCDCVPDVFDVIYLIDYVFSGGPAPCDPCQTGNGCQ